MKRFVWRLQKVLDIKAKEEQVRQMELLRLTEMLAERRSELLMRQQTLRMLMNDIARDRSAGRLGTQEFFLKHAATNDQIIEKLKGQIRDLEVQRREKTTEVLTAKRFREGLEKLRTEARERFIQEQEKLEQKEMDERTTITFAQNESMKP
ncbi:MAG: flagellar FliJ family protein [Planctomycetota bacterium]|jgi:flagellar export protein FliJ